MLKASNIHLNLGNSAILRGVDFVVEPGELIVVVGPNGSGKTSLLSVLSGLYLPTLGEVILNGINIKSIAANVRAQSLALLPQNLLVGFDFKVQEVVALGRYPYKGALLLEDKKIIAKALAMVKLEELAERNYYSLSGGEQQRVHLARALAQIDLGRDGSYLLLDESVAHLDLAFGQEVFKLLTKLAKQGVGVVAVVHDLNLAMRYADKVVVLSKGKIGIEGSPKKALTPCNIKSFFGCKVGVIRSDNGNACYIIPN